MTRSSWASPLALKWFFNFFIPLLLLLLPETEVLTWNVKLFLAITLWAVIGYALEITENLVISLIMMFLYCITGIAPMKAVLGPWTGDAVWMTVGALLLVSIVQKTTILKRLAYHAAIRTNGSYMKLVLATMTIALIARIFLQGTMASVAVIAISFGICESLGLGKSRASAGIMTITVIGYMDANFFLYSPDFISILYSAASSVVQVDPSYPAYFRDNAIFVIGYYLVGGAVGYFCRPEKNLGNREVFERQLEELGKLLPHEKKLIAVLVSLVVFLFTYQFHHVDMVYGFIFAPMLLFMPGFNVGNAQAIKEVPYPVLFFITACMSIGAAGNAVGFGQVVSATLVPMLQGVSETIFLYAAFFSGLLLNFIMTPLAEMAALGLPFAQICQDLGFSIKPMFYMFFQGCAQLWLPYETAVYLVAFSMGLTRIRDFVMIMTIKFVINLVFLSTAGILWWKYLGLL